jgi:alpha-glucoside transport system permease protein
VIWTLPTLGLLISSLRDKDQIAVSGWWTALTTSRQEVRAPAAPPNQAVEKDGKFVIRGNSSATEPTAAGRSSAFGTRRNADATGRRPVRRCGDGGTITVSRRQLRDGYPDARTATRGPRIFYRRRDRAALHARELREVLNAKASAAASSTRSP